MFHSMMLSLQGEEVPKFTQPHGYLMLQGMFLKFTQTQFGSMTLEPKFLLPLFHGLDLSTQLVPQIRLPP